MNRQSAFPVIIILMLAELTCAAEFELLNATGREIMDAVSSRHEQYPYVYEEQSMVLIDRNGNRETRKLRRFSRIEQDRQSRLLLLFDSPEEVKGVAVLANLLPGGETRQSVYLPAFGKTMIESGSRAVDSKFLGTDFSVENLIGENLDDYDYRRQRDAVIDDIPYFIIDVYDHEDNEVSLGQRLRRHYTRQDNLYITRTDHFDDLGRLKKRQSQHDLTPVLGEMWRANMMFMEDKQEQHQTLIKINRRVFSGDYVPAEMFTPEWLFENQGKPVEPESDDDFVPEKTAEVTSL